MGSLARALVSNRPMLQLITNPAPRGPGRPKKLRPMGEICFERLHALICEIGADLKWEIGWQARAAEDLGLHSSMISLIYNRKYNRRVDGRFGNTIGVRLIDKICEQLRIKRRDFLDED